MKYNYSVVIPVRYRMNLLYIALASIPDRKDIQIIIVDNTPESMQKDFICTHKLATVLYLTSSPTGGAGCARNVGMASSKGRWFVFLDSDDYFTEKAFDTFDSYLDSESDIIFFDMKSVILGTSEPSSRLDSYSKRLAKKDENLMRFRSTNPVGKMIKRSLITEHNILFQEVRIADDAWFSLVTGYHAKSVTLDTSVVYCATESAADGSLMKTITPENSYTCYCVAMQCNQFLESVGIPQYRGRLLAMVVYALKNHGIKSFIKFVSKAIIEKENIFTGLNKNDK